MATARGHDNHVTTLHHLRGSEARGEVAYQHRAGVRVESDRHQPSSGHGKLQRAGTGRDFPVLDFFGDYAERKGLGLYRCLFGGCAVTPANSGMSAIQRASVSRSSRIASRIASSYHLAGNQRARRLQNPVLWRNIAVKNATFLLCSKMVTSGEFKRWLEQRGCSFSPAKGSHLKVWLGRHSTILPMHAKKEIGKGLEKNIKKDLGLK
jgi:mRNA interferase HicA